MDFVEDIWVREERAEAGLGAKIDRPAAVLGARKVGGVGVAKAASAEGDELRGFLRGIF